MRRCRISIPQALPAGRRRLYRCRSLFRVAWIRLTGNLIAQAHRVENMQTTATSVGERRHTTRTPPSGLKTDGTDNGRSIQAVAIPGSWVANWLFSLSVVAVLYFGWSIRDQGHLSAELGLGYALGIAGASLMLLLLLYPLSKRTHRMRRWVHTRHWFRMHMIFGILGPALIVLHSGFSLDSTNGSVALISMLAVAASGIVGRYFYTKIHHGLYGRRANLEELKLDSEASKLRVGFMFEQTPHLSKRVQPFHAMAMTPAADVLHGVTRVLLIGLWTRWEYLSILMRLNGVLDQEAWHRG